MSQTVSQALEIMWKGMVSIFVVIVILTLLVYLTRSIFNKKDETKKEQ